MTGILLWEINIASINVDTDLVDHLISVFSISLNKQTCEYLYKVHYYFLK